MLKKVTTAALIELSFLLACYRHNFVLAYLEIDDASVTAQRALACLLHAESAAMNGRDKQCV
jgi:hypothetical protein